MSGMGTKPTNTYMISADRLKKSTCLTFFFAQQALQETGTYANVFVSKAAGGDTGLHLAITLGSLRAAQVACNPCTTAEKASHETRAMIYRDTTFWLKPFRSGGAP